jgi:hypothetical protein
MKIDLWVLMDAPRCSYEPHREGIVKKLNVEL